MFLLFVLCPLYIEMQDPCRPGVKDAVQLCQKAGVEVLIHAFDVEIHFVPLCDLGH